MLSASGDIIVDATIGSAVLTTGNAGRDGIVVAPTVSIGTLTAGDDIVAVATGGTLTAGTLISTGANSGDGIAAVFRADGTGIVDPVAGGVVGNLSGGNVVALATGDVSVMTATATAAPGATVPGLVRLGSQTGIVTVTGATATAGDLVLTGATIDAATLSAGRDATITATGVATLPALTAGRDVTITAASASLGAGTGLVAAGRNLVATTSGVLMIGTARAGEDLTATGGSVLATTLGAGDALTVTATNGDATVTTATSTGLPLLADFSGFATTGTALGTTRDITVTAQGVATLTTGTAVHGISVTGDQAVVTTATANTGGTDGDLTVSGATSGAALGTGSARDVLVSTTAGDVTVGSGTALRDIILTTQDGTATLTTAVSGRDTRVTGSDVTVGTAAADTAALGGDLVLVATGATLPTEPIFFGDAVLGQGAGRDISITAANQATATTATASRDLIMTAPNVTLVTGMAGRDILLTGEFGPAFGPVDVTSATANTAGGGGLSNPGFLRPCHGIAPPDGRHLHFIAVDLGRRPDGQMAGAERPHPGPFGRRVCVGKSHRHVALPGGIVSRPTGPPSRRVLRSLRDNLNHAASLAARRSRGAGGEPQVVLLTPGPYNETYFEHAYLARYLGYPLVAGEDLTVRYDRVYLKTLSGLQPVDGILRRLDDDYCDPLWLRAGSAPRRAGASRGASPWSCRDLQPPRQWRRRGAGNAWLFPPQIAGELLGEALQLAQAESIWLGEPGALDGIVGHFRDYVIKPAFRSLRLRAGICDSLDDESLEALEAPGAPTSPRLCRAASSQSLLCSGLAGGQARRPADGGSRLHRRQRRWLESNAGRPNPGGAPPGRSGGLPAIRRRQQGHLDPVERAGRGRNAVADAKRVRLRCPDRDGGHSRAGSPTTCSGSVGMSNAPRSCCAWRGRR